MHLRPLNTPFLQPNHLPTYLPTYLPIYLPFILTDPPYPPLLPSPLQVHDEVILEGPRETAAAARERVVACMRSPFSGLNPKPLLVDLLVDCKSADTWYEAK